MNFQTWITVTSLVTLFSTVAILVDCKPVRFQTRGVNGSVIITHARSAQWVTISSSSDAILRHPEPAGIEAGNVMYLCRGRIGHYLKPGKLWAKDGLIYCSVPFDGNEQRINELEMLEAPAGYTSWIPMPGHLPDNAIFGGHDYFGNIVHICRGLLNDDLIVGHFASNLQCYSIFDSVEVIIPDSVEILVVNEYGKMA